MADLKVWAISLCIAAIAGAIMNMLVPSTSLEKIMKLVIGAFLLSCVISPVFLHFPEIKLTLENHSKEEMAKVSDNLRVKLDEQVTNVMTQKIEELLAQKDIIAENILFRYNTADNASISISQIDIVLNSKYISYQLEIEDFINEKTGKQVTVSYDKVS